MTRHAVVWIDYKHAEIIYFDRSSASEKDIKHKDAARTIHHKAGTPGPGHASEDKRYLSEVATALREAAEILIVGPSEIKLELKAYIEKNAPDVAKHIIGVEPLDHPTKGELLAFARRYAVAKDRMLGRHL